MKLFTNNKTYSQFQFDKEADFEREVVLSSKQFFGTNSIYIDSKRKIETKSLGNSIPDGFLFDLSDKENPEFYIVEVELESHSFYNHIFPQITKFFGFYRNLKSQNDLVEKTIRRPPSAVRRPRSSMLVVVREYYPSPPSNSAQRPSSA